MQTDTPFEQRLLDLYAVPVPPELDRRIAAMVATPRPRRSFQLRPRVLTALAVAAIAATAAAGPAIEWFQNWSSPFDRLWELATPVDQTVTSDGYRVTLHRAYADRLGVRLAITVIDQEKRWSVFYVDGATLTDADGHVYEGWNWSGARTPVVGSSATWSRFLLPAGNVGDEGDNLQLRVRVTSLAVRAPEPVPSEPDPAQIWTSVSGAWDFELSVPITPGGLGISPAASSSANGVTINLEELAVVPSGTVVRFAVEGLPEPPAESLYGWLPSTRIEHDGERLNEQPLEPGIVGTDGSVTLEATPATADLAGHWRITIEEFYFFSSTGPTFGDHDGPWVLEFDVPEAQ
ncbi:MAG TPA: DUF4179 domain-containing protein [Propionicimonas sp.]